MIANKKALQSTKETTSASTTEEETEKNEDRNSKVFLEDNEVPKCMFFKKIFHVNFLGDKSYKPTIGDTVAIYIGGNINTWQIGTVSKWLPADQKWVIEFRDKEKKKKI